VRSDGQGDLGDAFVSLADFEREAQRRLGVESRGYIAGGAADEVTLRDNEAAWGRLAIMPRMLVGVDSRDSSVTVLSRRRPHPVIVAPTAFQRLAHPDGECATARAAAATGTIMCVSTLSSDSAASVAAAAPNAGRWFQLYVFTDRSLTRELMAQAIDHGYEALVVTVDAPVSGLRERELRTPAETTPAIRSLLQGGPVDLLSPGEFGAQFAPDLRWADIETLARDCPLPVIVKGILAPDDARLALEHGARGVIVSNHGGRQLDSVPAGVDALAGVVDAVGDQLDVLVDGGIRRGTDVFKALALGACAVLIGRPVVWGLAVDGQAGAQRVLEILLDEFDRALALAGAPSTDVLRREMLVPARWHNNP
jgi:isopentenyl diphosphate isomerase/L-lactate dehydrogenase-like FMN-dependent dehydrogenase